MNLNYDQLVMREGNLNSTNYNRLNHRNEEWEEIIFSTGYRIERNDKQQHLKKTIDAEGRVSSYEYNFFNRPFLNRLALTAEVFRFEIDMFNGMA